MLQAVRIVLATMVSVLPDIANILLLLLLVLIYFYQFYPVGLKLFKLSLLYFAVVFNICCSFCPSIWNHEIRNANRTHCKF